MPEKDVSGSFRQLATFGMIGVVCFLVDFGVYNLLRLTILDNQPIGAKVVSVTVATLVAWVGNRHLTFRKEQGSRVVREGILFAVVNILGLAIAAGCLFVSHYILAFHSQFADNIAGNGVGLVLGTTFRFLAYRLVVFRPSVVAADRRSDASPSRIPVQIVRAA